MPMPFKHILAATDFSPGAVPAVEAAARWAAQCGASLSIVNVFDPSPPAASLLPEDLVTTFSVEARSRAESKLATVRESFAGATAEVVAHSRAATGICEHARTEATDLIVVGTHGRSGLTRILLGSVAEHVARQAHCAVLAVRPGVDLQQFPRHVMVCTDMSAAADAGVVLGAAVAQAFDASATLAFVHDNSWWDNLADPTSRRIDETLRAKLTQLRDARFGANARAAFLRSDNPPDAIVRGAVQENVDLIVLATHGHTGVRRLVIGSVAERVARDASCPVLVARVAPDLVLA